MNLTPKSIENNFYDDLKALVSQKAYLRIQYYTDIHEFKSVSAVLKELLTKEGEEYLLLATGDEIRLDRLVRVGSQPAPGYDEDYFKCDC